MRRVTGYLLLLQGQTKVEMPLAGSVDVIDERPGDERGATIYRRRSSVSAPTERARDVR